MLKMSDQTSSTVLPVFRSCRSIRCRSRASTFILLVFPEWGCDAYLSFWW